MAGGVGSARLKDVAQAAGVSVATVSRYLNRSLHLPGETASRIERAIRVLDYRPNPHARRLSLGRSDTIGLVVPELANPFFAELADAVEDAAAAHGLGVLLCATRNRPERELDYLARIGRTLVDGLLFVTNHADDGSLARAVNADRGVVLLDEDIAGTRAPKVLADNRDGGRLAGRHLIAAGHRRLGFIGGPPDLLSTRERLAGLHDAVQETGPGCAVVFESFGTYEAETGRLAAHRLAGAADRPTALFATSDEIALGLLDGLRAGGLGVPGDVSLVTFDDVGPLHLLDPPLSAVRQPVQGMARRGVELLLARLRGEATPRQPVRLPVEFIRRGSVAAPVGRGHRTRTMAGEAGMTGIGRRSVLGVVGGVAATLGAGTRARAQAAPIFALVQINQQALFFNQMNAGAQDAAKKAGAQIVIFNANDQPAQQNDAIETYTQQKVAGIIVDAIDVNGIMPAVQSASAAGIPVIAVDSILPAGPQKAQVGVDNAKAGHAIGAFFLDYVKSSMGGKARLGIVGALNSMIQNVRQQGFEDAVRGQPGVQLAGVVDGRNIQDNALTVAETLLTANPDLTAIYATGEPALLGAIAAVNSQGRGDVKIFGWDLTAQAITGLDAGTVVAVVQQDPAAMGATAVDALMTLRRGGTVAKDIPIPITIVTKANVQPYRAVFK